MRGTGNEGHFGVVMPRMTRPKVRRKRRRAASPPGGRTSLSNEVGKESPTNCEVVSEQQKHRATPSLRYSEGSDGTPEVQTFGVPQTRRGLYLLWVFCLLNPEPYPWLRLASAGGVRGDSGYSTFGSGSLMPSRMIRRFRRLTFI